MFLLSAIFALVQFLILTFLLTESPSFLASKGYMTKAAAAAKKIYRLDTDDYATH
jgi:hypothetical protein